MSDVKDENVKNHLLESGGSMGIYGKTYPDKSMFKDVTIMVANHKERPILIKMTEKGLLIELVRDQ
jgi:hypothetical protein